MSVVTWIHEFNAAPAGALPRNVFRYVLGTSGLHQLFLLGLTVSVFLLEVVPLELQRRIVNNLVKHRPFSWVVSLCAVYAGIVLVQGGTKLALNIYRGWVGERAKRELRRRVHTFVETPDTGLGDTATGDVERTAMADAGEQQARSDRQRGRIPPGQEFDGDMSLVVIHRDKSIELAPSQHQICA